MSHDSYICGFIKLSESGKAMDASGLLPANSSLDIWPFLTRSMFSLTESPEYRDEIIHFAASDKDILGSWNEWVLKFSKLLQQFDFDEIKLIVEDCYAGDHVVRWKYGSTDRPICKAQIASELIYEDDPDFVLFANR